MAEGAEGLEVSDGMSTAADHRLPEIEMRGTGGERSVAPGAPVALPLEDDPHDLVRDVCPRDMYLLWCPLFHTHDERETPFWLIRFVIGRAGESPGGTAPGRTGETGVVDEGGVRERL